MYEHWYQKTSLIGHVSVLKPKIYELDCVLTHNTTITLDDYLAN